MTTSGQFSLTQPTSRNNQLARCKVGQQNVRRHCQGECSTDKLSGEGVGNIPQKMFGDVSEITGGNIQIPQDAKLQVSMCRGYQIQIQFIVLLGLVFMGRHKCEAVACLSSQVKCNFYELFIVHFIYGE